MSREYRHDEQEMAQFLNEELKAKDPRTYTELYAGLQSRNFIPKIPGIDATDRTYEYEVWQTTGEAKFIGEHARDLPIIEVGRRPVSVGLTQVGAKMRFSVTALRGAMRVGKPIEEMTLRSASTSIMRKIDRLGAIGNPALGVTGLANDANILANNSVVAQNNWGATPTDWLASLNKLVAVTRSRLEQAAQIHEDVPAFAQFRVILPPTEFSNVMTTPLSANISRSVGEVFLENNRRWVSGLDEWNVLQDIHAGGKPRAVCLPVDPSALGFPIADQEFIREPPQFVDLDVLVPVWTAAGPPALRFKVAMSYMLLAAP